MEVLFYALTKKVLMKINTLIYKIHTCSNEYESLCLFYKSSGYPSVLLRNSRLCSVFHLYLSQSTVNQWYDDQAICTGLCKNTDVQVQ